MGKAMDDGGTPPSRARSCKKNPSEQPSHGYIRRNTDGRADSKLAEGKTRRRWPWPKSRRVGQKDGGDESRGHESGRRIVEILEKDENNIHQDDINHMRRWSATSVVTRPRSPSVT